MGAKRKSYIYIVPAGALAHPEKWCVCPGKYTGMRREKDGVIRCVECGKPVHDYTLEPK